MFNMADDIAERLIIEVKKKILFDKTNSGYKDAIKKKDFWDAIRLTLRITGKCFDIIISRDKEMIMNS